MTVSSREFQEQCLLRQRCVMIRLNITVGHISQICQQNGLCVGVLPLRALCQKVCITRRSENADFMFIKTSLAEEKTPDYHGFCTREARQAGDALKPKTKVLYRPMIDQPPTEPSTILTAMLDAERISKSAKQTYTIFTSDQQLYKISLDIV